MFAAKCEENKEDHTKLLWYSPIRWLNQGKMVERFYSLRNSIVSLLTSETIGEKGADIAFLGNAKDIQGIAFLADMIEK